MLSLYILSCAFILTGDNPGRDDFSFASLWRGLFPPQQVLASGDCTNPIRVFANDKGFACAWCYTLGYALDIPDKAIAFSNYMAYWRPDDQPAIWITIFIIAPLLFNLLDVRRYGEIEFIFTTIKIYAIFGIIALGFIIIAGGTLTTPLLGTNNAAQPVPCGNNQTDPCLPLPGFKCIPLNKFVSRVDWQDSSAFKPYFSQGAKGKVAGFWDCCTLAIFSYTGNEVVAITAWETEYPRYSLPKAVRRVSGRIVLYYTVAIFFLGLTVSSNDPLLQLPTNTNPRYHGGFIIMAERAGIPVVPHIINAVMILSVLTVVTIDIYVVVLPVLFAIANRPESLSCSNGSSRIHGTKFQTHPRTSYAEK